MSELRPRRLLPKRRLQALLALLGLGLVVVAGVRWWNNDPRPDRLAQLGEFPTPNGWSVTDRIIAGDRPAVCDLNFTCETPRVSIQLTPGSYVSKEEACRSLEDGLLQWEAWVSQGKPDDGFEGWDCAFDGELDGRHAQAFIAVDEMPPYDDPPKIIVSSGTSE
jgi:hypothetical protein